MLLVHVQVVKFALLSEKKGQQNVTSLNPGFASLHFTVVVVTIHFQ